MECIINYVKYFRQIVDTNKFLSLQLTNILYKTYIKSMLNIS